MMKRSSCPPAWSTPHQQHHLHHHQHSASEKFLTFSRIWQAQAAAEAGKGEVAVARVKALAAQDMSAADMTVADLAMRYPAVVSSLLQAWMAEVSVLRSVKQQRAGVQQLILGIASTRKRLQAAAGDITAAAVQAAVGVVAQAAADSSVAPAAAAPAE